MPRWRPSQIAPRIRADALDALVYPELGMAAVTFALAALRLAPLQCAGWGHPVTTGLPAIDVFLSSACMEPADGASHYSERLVTLPGIGTRYAAPVAPPVDRARVGLPDGPLLLCPQSLFKIHPDNDALFARVLEAVPNARLVFYEGRDRALTAKFKARVSRAGIAADRIVMLAQRPHADFLAVNAACDVMLDTLRWSGGNTSLDAIASGLPIVTLPGRFMRGRQSAGMLQLMDMPGLVAKDEDDYVQKVKAIANDGAYRSELSRAVAERRERIFDDAAPVAALGEFLAQRGDR
jgi:CRISPR-associated protein Csy1